MSTHKVEDRLDPEIALFHRRLTDAYAAYGDLANHPVTERRQIAETVRIPWRQGGPEMAATTETKAGTYSVRVRIYRPHNVYEGQTLIYLHGGGWTLFSLDTHDRLMREMAERAKVTVVGVDYSLSPEVRFPRAIDEIVSVVEWLRSGADGAPRADKIAIGGDSAGANLACATNLKLRDLGMPVLDAMILNYGVYDHKETPSYARYDGPDYLLTRDEMLAFWTNYVGPPELESSPLAFPLRAVLRGMPPTLLVIAECDILLDENLEMAKRLEAAGVDVTANIYVGATHSFLEAMSISKISNQALDESAAWLDAVLRTSG